MKLEVDHVASLEQKTQTEQIHKMGSPNKKKFKFLDLSPYIFVAPFFLVFAIFMLYPLIYSLILSFGKWRAGVTTFVGLENYKLLLTDPLFWKSLGTTGLILIIQVPIMLILATVIASVINSEKLRFKGAIRLGFFLPALIDLVTYALVFSLIFNESYGMINQALEAMGLGSIKWLSDGTWAKVLIIIEVTWR